MTKIKSIINEIIEIDFQEMAIKIDPYALILHEAKPLSLVECNFIRSIEKEMVICNK